MEYLINIFVLTVSFVLMELVAWYTHKYVMHGFLWKLHGDHHHKPEDHFFEKNDFFFLIFAMPGIFFVCLGVNDGLIHPYFWIGLGITIYGFCYFLIHDVFIHQRFKWFKKANSTYFRAIRKAHKMHHKHLTKENGECFGMLWVPIKYYKEAKMNHEKNKNLFKI